MDDRELEVLLNEYDRVQEIAHHSDGVFWEITSIVWGASTLLLGFVLEAIRGDKSSHLLIQFTAIIGAALNLAVLSSYYVFKLVQNTAYDACRDIESKLDTHSKIHIKMDKIYPRYFIRNLVWTVTVALVTAWGAVGYIAKGRAGVCLVVGASTVFALLLLLFWHVGLTKARKPRSK